MRRLLALLTTIAAIAACGPSRGRDDYRWRLVFQNDSPFAQDVVATCGAAEKFGEWSFTVPPGQSVEVPFATLPPSWLLVKAGWGTETWTWPGASFPWPCPFWVWRVRFPSGDASGALPVR